MHHDPVHYGHRLETSQNRSRPPLSATFSRDWYPVSLVTEIPAVGWNASSETTSQPTGSGRGRHEAAGPSACSSPREPEEAGRPPGQAGDDAGAVGYLRPPRRVIGHHGQPVAGRPEAA